MAVLACELGRQKGPGQIFGQRRSDHSGAKTQDVHVVMFHHLVGGVGVVGGRGAYATNLVGGNAGARAGSANNHGSGSFSFQNGVGSRQRGVRIVDRFNAVSAKVEHGVALFRQKFDQVLLELKPGMIGGDGDSNIEETVHHPGLPGLAV